MSRAAILAIGFLVLFVGGGARFAIGLTLKSITEDFAIGRTVLGLTVAVYLGVTSACMFLAGRLADRLSVRAVLLWGLVVSAVGMSLMSLMSAPWQLLALYGVVFAVGNGVASITPVSLMVTRAFPDRAGLANGVASAGMSAGQLVIIALFTLILAHLGVTSSYGEGLRTSSCCRSSCWPFGEMTLHDLPIPIPTKCLPARARV